MHIYKLNKTILSIKNNPVQFLNGLTSNDMDKPDNAFLTIHGRIVATFDQVKVSDDEYYLLFEEGYVEEVLTHIDRYVKLGGQLVEQRTENVYFDLEGDGAVGASDIVIAQNKGRMVITKDTLEVNVTDEEFTLFRLNNNIPLQGKDYNDEMLLNVSMVHFVSFTKGCYLGQEPISKVYNRSKPTWSLVVKNKEDCSEEEQSKMTSVTNDPATGKELGFVFTKNQ